MFERMSTGWQLVKQSWQVLKLDKELLLFPMMSGVACLLVMASFALPLWATGYVEAISQEEAQGEVSQFHQAVGVAVMFAYYFVNYFVIVFFNSALIACSIIRFKGGNPTLADGISASMSRLPQIAGWAFLAATVGVILKLIESRSEKVGAVVVGLLGMAWSAVTFFVVPVIVVEKAGPITAFQRSTGILKKTWGEAPTANFGVGFIIFLASLVAIIPLGLGFAAISAGQAALGMALIAIGIVALILVTLISSALNSIIVGALYLYASEGSVPQQFDDDQFRRAFVHQ